MNLRNLLYVIINNTLAHECFHWYKHRTYFRYKRKNKNAQEFAFRCNKYAFTHDESTIGEWSDIDRMEWQAKTIAPKILMPRKAFRSKVKEEYANILKKENSIDRKCVTSEVIEQVANFFNVSRQSVAIRMSELGFSEAEDFCNNNAYERLIDNLGHKKTKAKHHQKPIGLIEAFALYENNEFLRTILDTGAFCYAEGFFVLRNSKYVDKNCLTDYAKQHLAECALDFSIKLIPEFTEHRDLFTMFRSDCKFTKKQDFEYNSQNVDLHSKANDFREKFRRIQESEKHKTPQEWMRARMNEANWYAEVFIEKTGLDKMHFSRLHKKEPHNFDKASLLAMGVGLGLDVNEMEYVLKLGGMAFKPYDKVDQTYKYLFVGFYKKDIDVCNEFLENQNVPTLGTKSRL